MYTHVNSRALSGSIIHAVFVPRSNIDTTYSKAQFCKKNGSNKEYHLFEAPLNAALYNNLYMFSQYTFSGVTSENKTS